ncbi:hypothetical protein ACIBSS_30785 [Micromonospora aurantiaca]|uniref:hypothetical protein n=1 Tax=Micromonospora aurantiaca (nom. illeg.) TaxID=47850 RepID=UPI0033F7CEA3
MDEKRSRAGLAGTTTRRRAVGVLVLVAVGGLVWAFFLLVVSLVVRLFGNSLSAGARTAMILAGTIVGAALAGWSAQAVLGPAVERFVSSWSRDR